MWYTVGPLYTKETTTVSRADFDNSNQLELASFKVALAALEEKTLRIKTLVTDQHVQIAKFVQEKKDEVIKYHTIDLFHLKRSKYTVGPTWNTASLFCFD
jgi:hypothetical protein